MQSPPVVMVHAPSLIDAPRAAALEVPRGQTLEWNQPSAWRATWRLRLAGREVATLQRRGWAGWTHDAESPGGRWTLRRRWIDNLDLSAEGSTEVVATFKSGWLGNGRILLAGGEELRWRRVGFSAFGTGVREIQNADESPLIRFRYRRSLFRMAGAIEVEDLGRRHPRFEALVVLGWALALFSRRRSHAH
jgi:hypothetical protein